MSVPAIQPIGAVPVDALGSVPIAPGPPAAGGTTFAQMLTGGIDRVNDKLVAADAAVQAFTLDDSIPIHQVTYALEEARLSFELMVQVRNRLLEGYQQLMNMQL